MLLKPGAMFGDYRVVRLVGRGGMSEVWLLEIESREEFCAVKILDPVKADEDETLRKRFLSEAKLAMSIEHPNFVKVYDIGEDPVTRLCYIIMEYVPGGTLAELISREGRLPFVTAVRLVRDLATLLSHVKSKGMVHRDLKPANIMFAADGSFRVADLGSVRLNAIAGDGMSPALTAKIGSFVGTPAYMAPEQMVDPRGVDARADIYSLGVMFFEMLTGRRPYPNLTSLQIMAKAVTGEPIPDVRTVDPSVPAVIANVIRAMCEPDREARVNSPQWIADCCSRVLERI